MFHTPGSLIYISACQKHMQNLPLSSCGHLGPDHPWVLPLESWCFSLAMGLWDAILVMEYCAHLLLFGISCNPPISHIHDKSYWSIGLLGCLKLYNMPFPSNMILSYVSVLVIALHAVYYDVILCLMTYVLLFFFMFSLSVLLGGPRFGGPGGIVTVEVRIKCAPSGESWRTLKPTRRELICCVLL